MLALIVIATLVVAPISLVLIVSDMKKQLVQRRFFSQGYLHLEWIISSHQAYMKPTDILGGEQ